MARKETQPIYCWGMRLGRLRVHLASSEIGACRIEFGLDRLGDLVDGFRRLFPGREVIRDQEANRPLIEAVKAAWENRALPEKLSLDVEGTRFQRSVWEAITRIPYGETRTYGEVARMVGRPGGARAIGQAMGRNPLPLVFP